MKYKVQFGIAGLIMGLFAIFGSLYFDQIRGVAVTSLGLYQIIGALLGYIILIAGLFLTLQDNEPRKSIQNVLYIGGGLITLGSALAEYLGVASPVGFDRYQIVGLVFGAALVVIGVILPQSLF